MRLKEFVNENASAGSTASGSIGTVAMPLGSILSRLGLVNTAKYSNSLIAKDRRKKHARR